MHPKLDISQLCSWNWSTDDDLAFYEAAGIARIGASLRKMEAEGLEATVHKLKHSGLEITNLIGVSSLDLTQPDQYARQVDRLLHAVSIAHELGAPVMVLTTGPAGALTWEDAADRYLEAMDPVFDAATAAGVLCALEHTLALRVDVGFLHSLRDAIDLARRAQTTPARRVGVWPARRVGVCMEINACWAERALGDTIANGVDTIGVVQLSDYIPKTLSMPNRAVPGDGIIPFGRILRQLKDAGYDGMFDVEIIGPRIDDEGYASAIRRTISVLDEHLTAAGF